VVAAFVFHTMPIYPETGPEGADFKQGIQQVESTVAHLPK
jgi:hypothetical protein